MLLTKVIILIINNNNSLFDLFESIPPYSNNSISYIYIER